MQVLVGTVKEVKLIPRTEGSCYGALNRVDLHLEKCTFGFRFLERSLWLLCWCGPERKTHFGVMIFFGFVFILSLFLWIVGLWADLVSNHFGTEGLVIGY